MFVARVVLPCTAFVRQRIYVWLKFCGAAVALMCFDCSLVGALLQGTVHQGQLEAYYRQVVDWSRIEVSPFALGAALTFNALTLHQVCKSTQRARLAPARFSPSHTKLVFG